MPELLETIFPQEMWAAYLNNGSSNYPVNMLGVNLVL